MTTHPFKKTWYMLVIAVYVGFVLLACDGSDKPASDTGGDTQANLPAAEAATATPTAIPAPTEADSAEAHFQAGLKLLDDEKYEEAIAEFDQAIALDPNLAAAYRKRGFAYGSLGQDEPALADFNKALELEPDNPDNGEIYFNLALAYAKTGDEGKAVEFWSKAIEAGQDSAQVYLSRGKSYFNLKNYQGAIADCTQAIELDAQLAEAYNLRGKANAYLNNFEQAIPDLSQAIELDPKLAEAYYNRAVCRTKLGQNDKLSEIIADMAKALELSEDPDIRQQAQQALENAYKNLTDPALRQQAAAALGLTAADVAPADYQTYIHDMDCSGYNKELKLKTFSVLYPKGFEINTCQKNSDSYVVFELKPDQAKQDTDFSLAFGYFYLDAPLAQLNSAYLKEGEKLLDIVAPQIASQLDAKLTSDKPLIFEGVPFYRRDYVGKLPDGTTMLARLTTIPNFEHGQGLFFMALKKVQSDPQQEFPEFDAMTQIIIGSVNFTPETGATAVDSSNSPEEVLQAVFDAAKNQDFANLPGLCDPLGKNDEDTALICAITTGHPDKDSFVEFFAKGKINGPAVIKGDQAEVPFLFGPAGDKEENMGLILREGQWYLLEF